MQKKVLFLGVPLLLGIFSFQIFGQTKIPRTVSLRRYQSMPRIPVYVPMCMHIRAPMPAQGVYFLRSTCQPYIVTIQNSMVFPRENIREYPSLYQREETQNSSREIPSYDRNDGNYETRIQNIESRLRNLESIASQIKARLDSVPSQNTISDGYNQRLVRLEEQMQALRDVLVELRNYLQSKK